jgi:hypothetical protein
MKTMNRQRLLLGSILTFALTACMREESQPADASSSGPPAAALDAGPSSDALAPDATAADGTLSQPSAAPASAASEPENARRQLVAHGRPSEVEPQGSSLLRPPAGLVIEGVDLAQLAPPVPRAGAQHDGHDHEEGAEELQADDEPVPAFSGPMSRLTLVGSDTHDFGSMLQGDMDSHAFELVVDGETELFISRIKPSCGCTVARTSLLQDDGSQVPYTAGNPIQVGARIEVVIEVKSDGRQGPLATKVALYCNDPRGLVTLNVKADIKPILTVDPAGPIQLGQLTSAQVGRGSARIRSIDGRLFRLVDDPQFAAGPLAIELVPLEPDAEGRSGEWECRATLGPKIPEGIRNYPIRLISDLAIPHPKHPSADGSPVFFDARSFVQAQVTGLVSANPPYLTFGMVTPGQSLERVVRIECHDDFVLPGEIQVQLDGRNGQPFPYPDAFATSIAALVPGKSFELKIQLLGLPETATGSFGGVLRLPVHHPMKDEITIGFTGLCRASLPASRAASGVIPPLPSGNAGGNQAQGGGR